MNTLTRSKVITKEHKNIVIYDLETTGLDYNNDKIIEISFYIYDDNNDARYNTILINPEITISKEATNIHKITNEMVKNKKTFRENIQDIENVINWKSENNYIYLVSHNNYEFDELFIRKEYERINRNIPHNFVFIDSLPILRNLLPLNKNLNNHRLQTLKKYFNIEVNDKIAHTAEGDIAVLITIWDLLKVKISVDKLINISLNYKTNLVISKYMNFGKYKDQLIESIPDDYVQWIIKNNVCNKYIYINNQYTKYLHNRFLEYNKYYNTIYNLSNQLEL